MKKSLPAFVIITLMALACNKNNEANPAASLADTVFTSILKNTEFVPIGHSIRSMDYDPDRKNLYFFKIVGNGAKGYQIVQYNLDTKQAIEVFRFDHHLWSNSNGSEGRRLRVSGGHLYVMGGANDYFHRLTIGNNTLALDKTIWVPGQDEPYDIAVADKLYIMTMRDEIAIGVVPLGSSGQIISPSSILISGGSSHGATLVFASQAGTGYIISRGEDNQNIETRNVQNGAYLRGVSVPRSSSNLCKDSKDRIYFYAGEKIYRFSPDLLTKEEFKAKGVGYVYSIAVSEDDKQVTIYATDVVSGVFRMKLPK